MMKKITILFATAIIAFSGALAQTPGKFKYQAALRNADGSIMANEEVEVEFRILEGSETGSQAFIETHSGITTTEQGIINLTVGSIQKLYASSIEWAENEYFIEVSVNGTVMGTSQILSVPYSMHAKNANKTESVEFSNSGTVMKDFIEITGTTDDTNNYMHIDYPEGYDQNNTRVLSFEVKYMNATWMGIGKNGNISVGLGETKIYLYYTDGSTYMDKPYRLIITKLE